MKIGNALISLALLSPSFNAFAEESIEGEYSTVTESQCNFTLTLNPKGKGYFVETCRREDGSHLDDSETKHISWKFQGNTITVYGLGPLETFTVHNTLSCEGFGETGSRFGLTGHRGNKFWKMPIKCK
jgi:hypothetical protein